MVSGLTFAILDGRGRVLAQGPGGAIVSSPGIVDQGAQRRRAPAEEGTAQPEMGVQAVPEVAAEDAEAVPEAAAEEAEVPAEAAVEEAEVPAEAAVEEAEVPAEAAVEEAAAPAGRGGALAWFVVWVLLVAAMVAGAVILIRRYVRQD
jgi:hypothetical protein